MPDQGGSGSSWDPPGPPATQAMPGTDAGGWGAPPAPSDPWGSPGPPATQAMPGMPPPGPPGPGFGPPGPSGPGFGFGPPGPGFGFEGPPGGVKKTNTGFLVVAGLVLLAVVGVAFAVTQGGDDSDDGGGIAAGETPGEQGGEEPDGAGLPGSDEPGEGESGETDLPDLDVPDITIEPPETLPPEVVDPPEPSLEPAEAEVNDCIAVDSAGYMIGTGSCSNGGTPYTVVEVVEGTSSCSDPEASYTPSGDHLLCLEVNLVLNHCYVFPEGAEGGVDGWIEPAGACQDAGTVHVIDILPGATDDAGCTTDYEWNYWYGFTAPTMVACVMKY